MTSTPKTADGPPIVSAAELVGPPPAEQHPLFPLDSEHPKRHPTTWIQVCRYEGGELAYARRLFAAEELTDLGQIYDHWGGGRYQLRARSGGRSGREHITGTRSYTIAGKSKPLDALTDEPAPAPTLPAAPAPMSHASDAGGGMLALLGPFLAMMAQQQSNTMTMFVESQKANTTLLASVLGARQDNLTPIVTALTAQSSEDRRATLEILRTAAAGNGGGSNQLDAFLRGLEFAGKVEESKAAEASGPSEIESVVAGLGHVAQLVELKQKMESKE